MTTSRVLTGVAALSATLWFLPAPAMATTAAGATCAGRAATIVVTSHSPHIVLGTGHRDVIAVQDAGHEIRARGGDDLVCGSGGADVVRGGAGHDVVRGHGGDDDLYGGDGPDDLYGGQGDDHVYGGPGDDHLYGGLGDDFCDGGAGHDAAHGDEHHVEDLNDTGH